ncbi:hypothetical protein KC315_g5353 [Hortaea werneckii]|nr:hypothetical protein KC315_g5353 [Hortaea werneckii]KAI7346060.1 hypothetical protein KC354_g14421 [Hortaea werneckii]
MLNSSLDIFEARMPSKGIGHDFGLLHALDERIAMYGWLLNTGVKLIIVVDMEGASGKAGMGGTAYIRLLRNPFYIPDDHDPKLAKEKRGSLQITSPRFIKEVERIGKAWYPGISAI